MTIHPRTFHQRMPGYAPTPLRALDALADDLNCRSIVIKDESNRLGLPAFKILGASWAIYRSIEQACQINLDAWRSFEELRAIAGALKPLTLVTATDGNHGRAVAHMAQLLGFDAHVWMPHGSAAARIEAIEAEGAQVTVVDGDHDAAVHAATVHRDDRHWLIQDTSFAAYHDVPAWIVQGYDTMLCEIDEQLHARGVTQPDVIIVPVGVGSLAETVVRHYDRKNASNQPRIITVEPTGADCLAQSLQADTRVSTPGPHRSIMAGLNCGTVSIDSWDVLRNGVDAAVTVDDDAVRDAMRLLAQYTIVSGESGAAAMAALLALRTSQATHPTASLITSASRVLILSTEGATDRAHYDAIIAGS